MTTKNDFYQIAPQLENQYDADAVLQSYLKRKMPKDKYPDIHADLKRMGERTVTDVKKLGEEAESQPPVHVPYDPWGRRIDEVKVCQAWKELDKISAEEGIVAIGYERKHGDLSRIHQFAKIYLWHSSSAMYSCPLAMTDGAARVLELHGSAELKERTYKRLISRDPKQFWTSGQWMTERTGGSDVSGTSTVARLEDGSYKLYGVKWFTSATTSQIAMTLARIEGEEKLSLFYVELRDDNGKLKNIQVNRLKDKLGTKALPTAELTLLGTPAILVGEKSKGVKTIATLFNITRVYNSVSAISYMRRGIALAMDYAKKRQAFGKFLIDQPLHMETLNDLQNRFEACFLLTMRAAELLGKEEMGTCTPRESATLRLLIPLAKLYTAKESIAICSEVIESFGGAGYIEDTGIPKLLRDAQVLSIWEGTTNVLSLDALRAIEKENAGVAFLEDMRERLLHVKDHPLKSQVTASMQELEHALSSSSPDELNRNARKLAMGLAKNYAVTLQMESAQ